MKFAFRNVNNLPVEEFWQRKLADARQSIQFARELWEAGIWSAARYANEHARTVEELRMFFRFITTGTILR